MYVQLGVPPVIILSFSKMKLVILVALIIQIQLLSLHSASNLDVLTDLNDLKVAVNRVKRAGSNGACIQPPETPDKKYIVQFIYQHEISNAKPGQEVPEFTNIISDCNEGYSEDNEYYVSKQLRSVCINSTWTPPILKCKRICHNFSNFSKFNMTCYRRLRGQKIPCTGTLIEGAIAKPRCQKKFRPDVNVNYKFATCTANGRWDKEFFKCIPDCGVADHTVSLIVNGYREKRGGAPWYVALYSSEYSPKKPLFICGGTLITAELVISAAHCFYDETFHTKPDIGYFYATVGKMTVDFETNDYPTTKTYKLKKIFYPDTTFKASITNYAGDIVVLQLSEKVNFSSDVFPACLHSDNRDRFNPGKDEKGKLSGFGETADGSFPSVLLSAELPAINYSKCLTKVKDDFQGSISVDKFCAGSMNGIGARKGDSGGGLIFMDKVTGLYHLRGIVSNKDSSGSSIATFTDVAHYMSWILQILNDIEKKSTNSAADCDGQIDCVDESDDEVDLKSPFLKDEQIPLKLCKSKEFQCTSGRCVDQNLACNGRKDCDDGTDETTEQCENNECSKSQFRCEYGACIDLKLKCDGFKNCVDGSDEFSDLCKAPVKRTTTPAANSSPPGFCPLPSTSEDKNYTVKCLNDENCNIKPGENVPKYTEISFKCNPGYQYDDPVPFISICSNGVWIPRIANCSKICKTLKPKNVDLVCYQKGVEVNCAGALVAGTVVSPRCKPQYTEENPVQYHNITCKEDGEWTNPLPTCTAECGKPYANVTKLIAYGTPEKYGESPWNVAIYDVKKENDKFLMCGGTIISPRLVISSAGCFFIRITQEVNNFDDYEIAVSKVSRDYATKDNGLTKFYKVFELFIPPGFNGTNNNYANDIVIIWLAETLSLSSLVLPACIRWTDKGPFNPGENTLGKVTGWGRDENGRSSKTLMSAWLPYVSRAKCAKIMVSIGSKSNASIQSDKFCAGPTNKKEASVRRYDYGGGFMHRDGNTGLYYLMGITSKTSALETYPGVFTDVLQYVNWISDIKNRVEKEDLD